MLKGEGFLSGYLFQLERTGKLQQTSCFGGCWKAVSAAKNDVCPNVHVQVPLVPFASNKNVKVALSLHHILTA